MKAKLERMIKNNEVGSLSSNDIPPSARWLYKKIDGLKKAGGLSIYELLNRFMQKLSNSEGIEKTSTEEESGTNEEENDEEEFGESVEPEEDRYRSIGKTLRSVVNPDFDFDVLNTRLDALRDSCDSSVAGLSKGVQILMDFLLTGKLYPASTPEQVFKLKSVDFGNHGIGRDDSDASLLNDQSLKALDDEKLFSYSGFWKIMSRCVGGRFPEKNTQ